MILSLSKGQGLRDVDKQNYLAYNTRIMAMNPDIKERYPGFGESAIKALGFAEDEAHRFNHPYIGTEHVLLGLCRMSDNKQGEPKDLACQALMEMGVGHINRVRSAVEFIIGRGDRMVLGPLGFTPRVKRVFELTLEEERRLRPEFLRVGLEVSGKAESHHLLLGLVREGEGVVVGVLESLGINLEKLRTKVLEPVRMLALQQRAEEEKAEKMRSRAGYEAAKRVAQVMENPGLTWQQRLEFGGRVEELIAEFTPKPQDQD